MSALQRLDVPIAGMDCTECTEHVQSAIAALPGVSSVNVLLASEKAIIMLDPGQVDLPMIRQAVAGAGYAVPDADAHRTPMERNESSPGSVFSERIGAALLLLFGIVLFVVIIGEWLGLFQQIMTIIPFGVGAVLVLVAGAPIFWNVLRAAWRRQIISHTLMSLGVLAALAVGQWVTALVVVFFMYVGSFVEHLTTARTRGALRDLEKLAPQRARVEREGKAQELDIGEVRIGDTVLVRPGEKIPVDGQVLDGEAALNQAAITGEAMPVQVQKGSRVFAATIAEFGSLRIRALQIGSESTFGRVLQLVQDAEANRAQVERFADKFSAYFLPILLAFAAVTFLVRRDPLATAAVLVVACSCSIALATPIAMLASIGSAARRGIVIRGGRVLEALAKADVVLLDKTGTLTLGKPQLTDVLSLDGLTENQLLALAASLERESEHPLARAVTDAAEAKKLELHHVEHFQALPGVGVSGEIGAWQLEIGRAHEDRQASPVAQELEEQGKSLLYVYGNARLLGVLAASDTMRPEIPDALRQLEAMGLKQLELLTGDNEHVASKLARSLGISYRANLLPQDKLQIVREYQAQGKLVVMIGDGVNDAPALAQAHVGIAMGAAGTDLAKEVADVLLMREDWLLVPETFRIAYRTMRVVKMNLGFTGVYNLVGLSLAALGILPPVLAAAAQSLPDLGIMANSSRLLRK